MENTNEQFSFVDFTGLADLTNIGAIQLTLSGPGAIDAEISTFSTFGEEEVPEPLTILGTLVAGGIGAAMKKRKEA